MGIALMEAAYRMGHECHGVFKCSKDNARPVCITKTEKAESEAQRGKPKGTLESESRNAIE